jgi:NADH:ubiquinone reductase (H+-translocating)
MKKKQILVLGAGFAGLWSAVGAVRKLHELGARDQVDVTVVNRTPYHNIRVRNYEAELSDVCIPLDDVLSPIGVDWIVGDVEEIDIGNQAVSVRTSGGKRALAYDRLVLALGSELIRPPIKGLVEHGFDVDTYDAAVRLDQHIQHLAQRPYPSPGQFTAIVIGAGLTGLEVATELPRRLAKVRESSASRMPVRVIVADRLPFVGSDMGEHARPVIEEALRSQGIEQRVNVTVEQIAIDGIRLTSGEWIDAATVVWCGGMRANPLLRTLPGSRDRLGRISVDEFMRVIGVRNVYAAGDVASAMVDSDHPSVMSCQHGRPMGRYAGHNVAADLIGAPLLPLKIDWYTTIVDLGPWGAVYTRGWDRQVVATGSTAKTTKETINRIRIYPPRSRRPEDILAAAVPAVQAPPQVSFVAPDP